MQSVGRKEELVSWSSLKALFPDNQCNTPFNRSDNLVGVMYVVAGPPATPDGKYGTVVTPRIPVLTHLGATHRDTKHSLSYHWICFFGWGNPDWKDDRHDRCCNNNGECVPHNVFPPEVVPNNTTILHRLANLHSNTFFTHGARSWSAGSDVRFWL